MRISLVDGQLKSPAQKMVRDITQVSLQRHDAVLSTLFRLFHQLVNHVLMSNTFPLECLGQDLEDSQDVFYGIINKGSRECSSQHNDESVRIEKPTEVTVVSQDTGGNKSKSEQQT